MLQIRNFQGIKSSSSFENNYKRANGSRTKSLPKRIYIVHEQPVHEQLKVIMTMFIPCTLDAKKTDCQFLQQMEKNVKMTCAIAMEGDILNIS